MNKQKEGQEAIGREELIRLIKARQAYGQAERWQEQLTELEELYPQLNIREGLKSPQLRAMLKAGVGFRTAFEAANMEQIRQYIELAAEKRAMARLAGNAGRVLENGVASSRSAPFASGAGGLSKEDREAIVKRVLKGEEIRL